MGILEEPEEIDKALGDSKASLRPQIHTAWSVWTAPTTTDRGKRGGRGQLGMYSRGVQKNAKLIYELADKLIPFMWGILRSTTNVKFLCGQEVLPLDSKNIERKF